MPLTIDHSVGYLTKSEREKICSNERRETDLLLSSMVSDVEVKLPYSRRPREIYSTELPKRNWPKAIAETYQANQVGSFAGNFDKSMTTTIRAGNTILTFEEFVNFRHGAHDQCRKYSVNLDEYKKLETTHKLNSLEIADDSIEDLTIVGPATLRAIDGNFAKILYTCSKHGCIFPCLCLWCNIKDDYDRDHLLECEHESILHPGFFDEKKHLFTVKNADSFNINYLNENLAFGNQFCTNRTCAGCVARYPRKSCGKDCPCPTCPNCKSIDVFKYPGTDKECSDCRTALLDHEAYHFVYHYMCLFCQDSAWRFLNNLTEEDYWGYLEYKRNQELRSCHYCFKIFYDRKTMIRHINIVHEGVPDKLLSCGECTKTFGSRQALRYHDMVEHQKLNLQLPCYICDKLFNFEAKLDDHMREVHRSFQVTCHICESNFKRQSNLNHHYKIVHDVLINEIYVAGNSSIPDVFYCHLCDMKTREKRTLNHHIKYVHYKEDQEEFECDQCQFKSREKKTMNRHKKIHEKGERALFFCDQCEFSTAVKYNLSRHKKIHDKEKSALFFCDQCDFSTVLKYTLNHHKKILHNHEKKEYLCDKCSYKTDQIKTLNRHTKQVHKKYFKCDQCEFRTIDEKELEKHNNILHYHCDTCEFKTAYRTILRDHIKLVHPDEIPKKKFRFNSDDQ